MRDTEQAIQAQPASPSDGTPPADDDYMGPRQLAYFRQKLLDWRAALLAETDATLAELRDASHHEVGDEADRANREASQTLWLRTREFVPAIDRRRQPVGSPPAGPTPQVRSPLATGPMPSGWLFRP